ncbi:MAG: hypothetical protein RSC80_10950, partial [Odoribacter sp.]
AAAATIKSYTESIRNSQNGAVNAAQAVANAVTAALSTTATVHVNVTGSKTVPGFAKGTRGAAPGLAVVGEDGPELVNFRGGEVVYTAPETQHILADAGEFSMAVSGMTQMGKTAIDYQNSLSSAMGSYYRGIELVQRSQVSSSPQTSYSYGDTYIVDGITYDDGSNVARAIKDIVRAARVERRR